MATLAGVDRRLLTSQARMEESVKEVEAAQVRAEAAEENTKLLQQALDYSEQKLAGRDAELAKVREELASETSERARLEVELDSERTGRAAEVAGLRAELEAEKEKVRAAECTSYLGHVKRFLKTFSFKKLLNTKAAPSFKMGYEECAAVVGEGTPYEVSKHGWAAYVAAKMQERQARPAEQPEPVAAEAPAPEGQSEFEVPMEELLSEDEAMPADEADGADEGSSGEEDAAGEGGAEEEAAEVIPEGPRQEDQP